MKKRFTFGDMRAKGVLGEEVQHLAEFRIVGGFLAARPGATTVAELEGQRLEKWKLTAGRVRMAPWPWADRARMLRATQAQAFFYQGTRRLVSDVSALRK
eukprot:9494641-Pyramimonas_sp.AAC.1